MRQLTAQEIRKLASRKGVRKIAVENFLMSMGDNSFHARNNLTYDGIIYRWNLATRKAIADGIDLAKKEGKCHEGIELAMECANRVSERLQVEHIKAMSERDFPTREKEVK